MAVVTGGGTGLGKATALELSRLCAAVAVVGRRREPLEETVAEQLWANEDVRRTLLANVPSRRFGREEEVAPRVPISSPTTATT